MTKKTKSRTIPPVSKHYFTSDHQKYIVEYIESDDIEEKNEIYSKHIDSVLAELINKIVFTYKFSSLPNVEELADDCKTHLLETLKKFDKEKGSKAFSYFSVVTRNWFLAKSRKIANRMLKEISEQDVEISQDDENIISHNTYLEDRESREFMAHFREHLEEWSENYDTDEERKVIEAIKILLKSSEEIPFFNRKAIYIYLREITGVDNKVIIRILKKIRKKYQAMKTNWNEEIF